MPKLEDQRKGRSESLESLNSAAAEERRRLSILRSLKVLHTQREERFDRIVRAAKEVLHVPIVVITLVEDQHCWFKAEIGIGADEMPRDLSICTICVAEKQALIIENALEDSRVNQLPMIAQAPHVRFYAGYPLMIQGAAMGTLCVLDYKPRQLSHEQQLSLSSLAAWVCAELERDRLQSLASSLEQNQARYSAVFQNSPHAIALFSPSGAFLEGNKLAEEFWKLGGRDLCEPSGGPCLGGEVMREAFQQALSGVSSIVEPFSVELSKERRVSLQGYASPLLVHGRLDGIMITLEDVSETVLASETQSSLREQVMEQETAALQADEGLRHFLSTLAHELRSPIAGLLGYAEILHENPESLDQEMVAAIHSCSSMLTELLDDLLDLERLKQKRLTLRHEPFHLGALVESVHSLHRSSAQAKNIHLSANIGEHCEYVLGDEVRVRQILSNLASNAIKYTPIGGKVEMTCRSTAAGYKLEVIDTGVGMSQVALQHVFEPFFQATGTAPDSKLGVGLGLAICKTLAQLMGGEMGGTSREGQGSKFWASLPLPPCSRPQQEPGCDAKLLLRVLVVDDNPINRRVIELQLSNRGAFTSSAQDGQEALKILEQQHFDAVLMDCQMPVLDGFTAARRIRCEPERYGRPWIVALTGLSAEESAQRCSDAGMDDFLQKPVRRDELHSKLLALTGVGSSA